MRGNSTPNVIISLAFLFALFGVALSLGPLSSDALCSVSQVAVTAGEIHTCVRKGPRALCFGSGDQGRTGTGDVNHYGDGPNEVSLLEPLVFGNTLETVSQVSAGFEHTCAVSNTGFVRCWGKGANGRLGSGGTGNTAGGSLATVPAIQFAMPEDKAVQVAAGHSSTCVLFTSGGVRCFGRGVQGRLGSGGTVNVGDSGGPGAMTTVPFIPFEDHSIPAVQVSASATEGFNCVLFANGGARCFGHDEDNRLGYGTPGDLIGNEPGEIETLPFIPFPSTPTIRAVQVSAGAFNTCFLFENGRARCIGRSSDGIIGDTDGDGFINFPDPASVRMTQISAGFDSACALFDNGKIRCWGRGVSGKLGRDSTADAMSTASLTPITFDDVTIPAVQISNSKLGACAVFSTGAVKCWGGGGFGRNGLASGSVDPVGDSPNEMSTLPDIAFSHDFEYGVNLPCTGYPFQPDHDYTVPAASITSRYLHTCVRYGGQVLCWGYNGQGQLGQGHSSHIGGTAGEISTIQPVGFQGSIGVVQLVSGSEHSCAVFSNGKVRCWGYNNNARLGRGSTGGIIGASANQMTVIPPIDFAEPSVRAVQVSCSGNHNCALFENGKIRCWGQGANGQLGYGSTAMVGNINGFTGLQTVPYIDFAEPSIVAKQVTAGEYHSCALFANGKVRCWGEGDLGRLGSGNTNDKGDINGPSGMQTVPYIAFAEPTITVEKIVTGFHHNCALFSNGKLRCWGSSGTGECGTGVGENVGDQSTDMPNLDFIAFSEPTILVLDMALADQHTCALFANGQVRCWGLGADGRLGTANTLTIGTAATHMSSLAFINFGTPTLRAQSVALGFKHTCVLFTNLKVKCFGDPEFGKIGIPGTSTDDVGDEADEMTAIDYIDFPPSMEPIAASESRSCRGNTPPHAQREYTTCDSLFRLDASLVDGPYEIGWPTEKYCAWCERIPGGGAWTNVLSKGKGSFSQYEPTPWRMGDPSYPAPMTPGYPYRMLSDREVHMAQAGSGRFPGDVPVVFRFQGYNSAGGNVALLLRARFPSFRDEDAVFGLRGDLSESFEFCNSPDIDYCNAGAWVENYAITNASPWVPAYNAFDTLRLSTALPADCRRLIFDNVDPNVGKVACFDGAVTAVGVRCFASGSPCSNWMHYEEFRIDILAVGSRCGDGIADGTMSGESCDDGNTVAGDGCSPECKIEDGWTCNVPDVTDRSGPTRCWRDLDGVSPTCGNGVIERDETSSTAFEECDDGNTAGGDGCSASCRIEYGFSCPQPGTPCVALSLPTCEHYYRRHGTTGDSLQTVGVAVDTISSWCIESGDGGAYSTVLQDGLATRYQPTRYEIGVPMTAPGSVFQKIDDKHARFLQGRDGTVAEWRVSSSEDGSGNKWFLRLTGRWTDMATGMGLERAEDSSVVDHSNPGWGKCYASSPASCTWVSKLSPLSQGFDTKGTTGADDCTRIFTDNSGKSTPTSCYTTPSGSERCFTAGATTCNHARITTLSISVRSPCSKCGDGCTDPFDGFEECDDGNTADGDGCSSTCRVEPGWVCSRMHFPPPPTSEARKAAPGICVAVQPNTSARSCLDHRRNGYTVSGVYPVAISSHGGYFSKGAEETNGAVRHVFCDMVTDPDGAGSGYEPGGWTLLSTFSQTSDNTHLPQWKYDAYYRLALWIDGASAGAPLSKFPDSHLVGRDASAWSHPWRDFLETGRTYEMRQHCDQGQYDGTKEVDFVFDVSTTATYKQVGSAAEEQHEENWSVREFVDITNSAGITWSRPAVWSKLWLPFRERDGVFDASPPMLTACSSGIQYTQCCSCEGPGFRRYGNAGVIGSSNAGNDPAFSFLPHGANGATSVTTFIHQSNAGGVYKDGSHSFPITCRYWSRPKPAILRPAGSDRLTPLVNLAFDPAHLTSGNTKVSNLGSLGSAADADLIGTCSGATGVSGDGVTFNGDQSQCRVEVPHMVQQLSFNRWTITFWFRFSSAPSTSPGQLLVHWGDGDSTWETGEAQIYLTKNPGNGNEGNNVMGLVMNGASIVSPATGQTPNDANWHHYALRSNGTWSSGRVFVDGNEVMNYETDARFPMASLLGTQHDTSTIAPASSRIFLGGIATGGLGGHTSSSADGTMWNFMWFPDALSADEVATLGRPSLSPPEGVVIGFVGDAVQIVFTGLGPPGVSINPGATYTCVPDPSSGMTTVTGVVDSPANTVTCTFAVSWRVPGLVFVQLNKDGSPDPLQTHQAKLLFHPRYESTGQSYAAVGDPLALNVTGTGFATAGGAYTCSFKSDDNLQNIDAVSVTVVTDTTLTCNFDAAGSAAIGTQGASLTIQETSPLSVAVPFATAQAKVTFVTLGTTTGIVDETDAFCAQNSGALGTCDFWHFGSLKSLVATDGTQHGCMCQCCAPIARRQPQRCQWTGMRGIDEGAGGSTPRDRLTRYIKIDRPQVTSGSGQCGDGLVARVSHACDALHMSPAVMEEQCDDGNNVNGDGCANNCRWE